MFTAKNVQVRRIDCGDADHACLAILLDITQSQEVTELGFSVLSYEGQMCYTFSCPNYLMSVAGTDTGLTVSDGMTMDVAFYSHDEGRGVAALVENI